MAVSGLGLASAEEARSSFPVGDHFFAARLRHNIPPRRATFVWSHVPFSSVHNHPNSIGLLVLVSANGPFRCNKYAEYFLRLT